MPTIQNAPATCSVKEVIALLQSAVAAKPQLKNICVVGEICDYRKAAANAKVNGNRADTRDEDKGHKNDPYWYFHIKDSDPNAKANITCLMSRYSGFSLQEIQVYRDSFKAGDKVTVTGSISINRNTGQTELRVTAVAFVGEGEYLQKLKVLREQMERKGLFSKSKHPVLPEFPCRIAIISRLGQEGYKDCRNTILSRWPALVEGVNIPLSGGDENAARIVSALKETDQKGYDLILLVRGGGSSEDLKIFNRMDIVQAVHDLKTPIITGIGHSGDELFVERAADGHGITPTAAGIMATPHKEEDVLRELSLTADTMQRQVRNNIKHSTDAVERFRLEMAGKPRNAVESMQRSLQKTIADLRAKNQERISEAELSLSKLSPSASLLRCQGEVDTFASSLHAAVEKAIASGTTGLETLSNQLTAEISGRRQRADAALQEATELLDAASPTAILMRGYSVTQTAHRVVKSVEALSIGEEITTRVTDGEITSVVTDIKQSTTKLSKKGNSL